MSVRLGKRTDTESHKEGIRLAIWEDQFSTLWHNLSVHCTHYLHSEKVIQRLQKRLGTAEDDGVDIRHIDEAETVLERHRASLLWRRDDIAELLTTFDGGWKSKPLGAEAWLKANWFANGEIPDPVLEVVPRLNIGTVWPDVVKVYEQRGLVTYGPVPF